MNMPTRISALLLACCALLAASAPAPLAGQAVASRPLFLALPESFPDLDARVVLMREPGRDIVIMRDSDASPETLQVALGVLERVRKDNPLPVDRGQVVPITGFAYRIALGPERRAALEGVLAELRERPLANVGNLGVGRWMTYEPR